MGYKHLTQEDRYQIAALFSNGVCKAAIARTIGCHRSTIGRELRRNGALRVKGWFYTAARAQERTRQRRKDKGNASRKIQGELKELIELKLQLGWSPEQISGRLKLEQGRSLSHETIYQHVLRDCHEANGTMRYLLRFGGYKYRRFRKSRWARTTKRCHKNRPTSALNRSRRGHWERDLMLTTRGDSCLLAVVDRHSRYSVFEWISGNTEEETRNATVRALEPFAALTRTITNDNGSEFKNPLALEHRLNKPVYYTDPSSPWQRGTVENTIGLARQYIPKGHNIPKKYRWVTQAIQDTLNFRPKKILGYRTPHEKFFQEKVKLLEGSLLQLGLKSSSCL